MNLEGDSLREEVPYKYSELMEQCYTDKTPNKPYAGDQSLTLSVKAC